MRRGKTRQKRQPRERLRGGTVADVILVHARLTHAGGLHIDDARIDLAQFLVAETPLVHLAGTEVLANRVRIAHQAAKQVATLRMIQVEGDSILAGIGVVEVSGAIVVAADAVAERHALTASTVGARVIGCERRHVADEVDRLAFAPFNTNHLRAEGCQQTRRLRPDL